MVLIFYFLISYFSFEIQAHAESVAQSSKYISQVDQELTIQKVAVLMPSDNLDNIYAKPIKQHLEELVRQNHQLDLVETNETLGSHSVEELEENPELVKEYKIPAQALFIVRISKGPKGIFIKMNLFLLADGKLLAQEMIKNFSRYEIKEILSQTTGLYQSILHRIPYSGVVLSRRSNKVTINIGKRNGINEGDILSAIQIISIQRHPKFQFLISSEKIILGQIKIIKADDTLSFGSIISEIDRQVIDKGTKIANITEIKYDDVDSLSLGKTTAGALGDRSDSHTSFGESPKEWIPKTPPSIGQIGLQLGLGSYSGNLTLQDENLPTQSMIYPTMTIKGELWFTSHLITQAYIRQGVISSKNPRSSSGPSSLSLSLNSYMLKFGYNFLIADDFFGPKILLLAGYSLHTLFADNISPTILTTTQYQGFDIGIEGSIPLTDQNQWVIGARLDLSLAPHMVESPVTSGAVKNNTINHFSFFGNHKLSENMKASASLNFDLFSSEFSGQGTRTDNKSGIGVSQKYTTLNMGIDYLF